MCVDSLRVALAAGSTVVITGASSGIGKEIALIYGSRKCKYVAIFSFL